MKVDMYDLMGKHHEVYIEGPYTIRIFVRHGIPEIISYYHIHDNDVMYHNYMGTTNSSLECFL